MARRCISQKGRKRHLPEKEDGEMAMPFSSSFSLFFLFKNSKRKCFSKRKKTETKRGRRMAYSTFAFPGFLPKGKRWRSCTEGGLILFFFFGGKMKSRLLEARAKEGGRNRRTCQKKGRRPGEDGRRNEKEGKTQRPPSPACLLSYSLVLSK